MKSLKLFLYIICIICLTWTILFFGGPTAIKRVIAYSFGDKIIVSNVTLTPSLQIQLGRVDFNFKNERNNYGIKGHSRAVRVSWSIIKNQPFLRFVMGPTFLEQVGSINSASIYTDQFSEVEFKKLKLFAEFGDVKINSIGKADKLNITSSLYSETFLLDGIVFDSSHIRSKLDGLSYVEQVSGSLSAFDLDVPLVEQILSVEIFGKNLSSRLLDFHTSDISLEADANAGTLDYRIDLSESFYPPLSASIEAIGVYGLMSIKNGFYKVKSDYILRNASILEDSAKIHKIDGNFESIELDFISTTLNAQLESSGINIGDTYFGKLPTSTFQSEVKLNLKNNNVTAFSELNIGSNINQKISGHKNLEVEFGGKNYLYRCLSLNCAVLNFDLNYGFVFDDERIAGRSFCKSQPCNFQTLSHSIKTSNTAEVFQALRLSNTLSPLLQAYLFAAFISGRTLGEGHELEL